MDANGHSDGSALEAGVCLTETIIGDGQRKDKG